MQSFAKSIKGCKSILVMIDVFSKYGCAIPLNTKTGSEVAESFQDLWERQAPPQKLWTDKDKEFYNKQMKDLLEKNGVYFYST